MPQMIPNISGSFMVEDIYIYVMYTSHSIPINFYPTSLGDVRICGFVWAMDPLGRTTAMMRWKIHQVVFVFFPYEKQSFPQEYHNPPILSPIFLIQSGDFSAFFTVILRPENCWLNQVESQDPAGQLSAYGTVHGYGPAYSSYRKDGPWCLDHGRGILIKHGASNGKIIGRCRE